MLYELSLNRTKEKEEKIWTYHFKDVLLQCEKKADGESLVKI